MREVGTAILAAAAMVAATPASAGPAPGRPVPTPGDRLPALPVIKIAPASGAASRLATMIRPGFGRSTAALYPIRNSGLHLTVGTRVATRTLAGQTVDAPWTPELWMPRGSGLRAWRRSSPTAMLGLDRPVGDGMTLGLDAGVAMGRINGGPRGPHGLAPGGLYDSGRAVNPLARVALHAAF